MSAHRHSMSVLISALLILAAEAAAAADTNSPHLYFVQITDTHFGSLNHAARMERVVDLVNHLPMQVEFVVLTGDIAAGNLDKPQVLAVATSVLGRIRAPLHCLPGNHDILPKRLTSTLNAYTNAFGPLATRAEYQGVVFLFLYTEPLRKSFSVPGYEPLAWLDSALEQAAGKPVVICHHTPSVEDFYNNAIHDGWPAAVREEWTRRVQSSNVQAVVAGHFHRDEVHWIGTVPLFVGSSVAGYWGRQGSFRIYEYEGGKLGYRTVYLDNKKTGPRLRRLSERWPLSLFRRRPALAEP